MLSVSRKFMVEVQLLHHFHNVFKVYTTLVIRDFQTFRQLSKQHHQVEICEASHFCIILELVAYKLIFLLKPTGICVTKTARNVHFGNMNFHGKMNSCSRCIFTSFLR